MDSRILDCHDSANAESRNDEVERTLLFAKAKRSKNFIMIFDLIF